MANLAEKNSLSIIPNHQRSRHEIVQRLLSFRKSCHDVANPKWDKSTHDF
jgi:hypothetical protein